jgi:hypothetical protein
MLVSGEAVCGKRSVGTVSLGNVTIAVNVVTTAGCLRGVMLEGVVGQIDEGRVASMSIFKSDRHPS